MKQESEVNMDSNFPYGSAFPGFISKSTALTHTQLLFDLIFHTPTTPLIIIFFYMKHC